MAGVLQDSDLQKHRLLNLDAFYFPNFVTVCSEIFEKMSQLARRTTLTYFKQVEEEAYLIRKV